MSESARAPRQPRKPRQPRQPRGQQQQGQPFSKAAKRINKNVIGSWEPVKEEPRTPPEPKLKKGERGNRHVGTFDAISQDVEAMPYTKELDEPTQRRPLPGSILPGKKRRGGKI